MTGADTAGGADAAGGAEGGPTDDELARAPRGRVRRAPHYVPFMVTGALLGLAAAVVLMLALPPAERFDTGAALGYVALVLGLAGALGGAVVAVVLDRPGR